MPHPDDGLIHAWLDDELDAADAARVEALVASDPAWSAAAAEARGLLAASSRIVGSLDRVPAHVIPDVAARGGRRPALAPRRWPWRVAAALALVAGSAVVLRHGTPGLPTPNGTLETAPTPAAAKQATSDAVPAGGNAVAAGSPARRPEPVGGTKSNKSKKELDAAKQNVPARDQGVAASREALRAAPAGEPPRAAPAPPPSVAAGSPAAQALGQGKLTRLRPSCFERLEPGDSASRIIRLDAAALADSLRLERFTLRDDTLAAVHGALRAVRVPCPQP